ncbi:ABC transporter substrate-binding protein [Candidimonas nitroreducens]|uniref:Leucine-binding protein domain-containing protein n=1 Tax=Candidimonas nitroreducens TaxID=683354 RepID=A0A225MEF0_9BURK|nr:ABC transporter substrate-binding protein [Candidimonas nitroreducens]OWT59192.1 hypothetical protein CEY11_13505 [Candidimonas nitroreducens]
MQFSKILVGSLLLLGTTSVYAQDEPVFTIGIVTAATGAASTIGTPANAAIALYEQQLAAQKGLPFRVRFVQYDDASDPTRSVTLVRKAIQEDKADFVICCTTTPSSMAVSKVSEVERTPTLSMASSADVVEPIAEKTYTFKTPITDRLMINHTLDYMAAHGVKTLAFMGLDDAYGEGGLMEMKAFSQKKGVKIVDIERFGRADTNFIPQALKVLQSKPDAVYIHAIPPSASLVQAALKRVGYKGPIYHGAGSATNAFITIGKSAVEGAIVGVTPITLYKFLAPNNPLKKSIGDFVAAYNAKYGQGKAEMFASQGYDAIGLAVNAMKRYVASGKKEGSLAQVRKDLRDELEQTHEYAGSVGIFNYSPTDHVGLDKRTLLLAQVKGGQFVPLEK